MIQQQRPFRPLRKCYMDEVFARSENNFILSTIWWRCMMFHWRFQVGSSCGLFNWEKQHFWDGNRGMSVQSQRSSHPWELPGFEAEGRRAEQVLWSWIQRTSAPNKSLFLAHNPSVWLVMWNSYLAQSTGIAIQNPRPPVLSCTGCHNLNLKRKTYFYKRALEHHISHQILSA